MWFVWGPSLGRDTVETHGQTVENTLTLLFHLRKHTVFFHTASYEIVENIATGYFGGWI